MSKEYINYLQFLAADYNVLYIGKDRDKYFDEIASYFMTSSRIDVNEEILGKITSILTKRHINLVIIDVENNDELASGFFEAVKDFNEELLVMLMFNPKEYKKLFEVVPLVDTAVTYPIVKKVFYKRLFTILSAPYAMNSIGRRKIVLKQENVKEESMEQFFDTYEGSSLFVSDDLVDMVNSLNAGNISHDFFANIADNIDKVADIFSKTEETEHVTIIYEKLAQYLRELDLNEVKPENLKGFSYLSAIISDVSVYLLDMFVDRIFKDVYVFEHSLQSNIEFMKDTLEGKNKDAGEIDFF
jgi:hypothetical protein